MSSTSEEEEVYWNTAPVPCTESKSSHSQYFCSQFLLLDSIQEQYFKRSHITSTALDTFKQAVLADMENVIECGVQCSMRGEGCHMFQWNDVTKDKCSNIQISKVLVSSGDVFPGNLRGNGSFMFFWNYVTEHKCSKIKSLIICCNIKCWFNLQKLLKQRLL